MKKLKVFTSFFLALVFIFTISNLTSFASTNDKIPKYNSNLITKNIDNDLQSFALKEFPKHINAIKKAPTLYGFQADEITQLKNLLINNKNKSFKIYNVNGDIIAVNKSEVKILHKNVNNKKELSKQQEQILNDLYSKYCHHCILHKFGFHIKTCS